MKTTITEQEQERWIVSVRECLTKANPDITVGEIIRIFNSEERPMDVLFEEFHRGRTPQQAYKTMVKKCSEYGLKL